MLTALVGLSTPLAGQGNALTAGLAYTVGSGWQVEGLDFGVARAVHAGPIAALSLTLLAGCHDNSVMPVDGRLSMGQSLSVSGAQSFTLEAGATSGDYIAGERAIAADIDAVAGGEVAAHFSEDHDFAGIDVGRNHAVATHGNAVTRQVDGTFHPAVDVKRLRTCDLAFDHQRFADRGLVRGGGCDRTRRRRSGFARGRESWGGGGRRRALRLTWPAWSRRLIRGFPHVAKVLSSYRFTVKAAFR